LRLDTERIIEQNGEQLCPVCKHKYEWFFEFDLAHGTDAETTRDIMPTAVRDKPSKHISFITISEEKVQFLITCPRCKSIHQTEPMSMKNGN